MVNYEKMDPVYFVCWQNQLLKSNARPHYVALSALARRSYSYLTFSVLDLGAWVGTWMVALGAYAGRQERPHRRQDDSPKDDLPDVYIPNELSANEIEKAFSLAGKKQAVIEANEVSYENQNAALIGS